MRAVAGGRGDVRGLPDERRRDRRCTRPAGVVPGAAPRQPGAVRLLHPLRRRRGAQLLAGALPAHRPRWPGRGQADQGDEPSRRDPGRGRAARRAAAHRREEPGREPDDRRPSAQRPRLGLRGRHRAGALADGGGELRDRAPARHHSARPVARRARPARLRARLLPAGLDDGRAEAPHDGDPRSPRGRGARPLFGGDRLARPRRRLRPQRRDPHDRPRRRLRPRSAPAARSSPSRTPTRSTRRCCSRPAPRRGLSATAAPAWTTRSPA